MAHLGEFGAELAQVDADQGEQPAAPDTFGFHGHEFTLPERVSSLPALRYAYNAQQVDAAQQRAQAAMQRARTPEQQQEAARGLAEVELAANAALYVFLRDMLPGGQWDRFEQVAAEHGADDVELLGVATKIMQAVAARPTRRSSGSPAGPSPTGRTWTGDSDSPSLPVEPVPDLSARRAALAEIHEASLTVEDLVRSGV